MGGLCSKGIGSSGRRVAPALDSKPPGDAGVEPPGVGVSPQPPPAEAVDTPTPGAVGQDAPKPEPEPEPEAEAEAEAVSGPAPTPLCAQADLYADDAWRLTADGLASCLLRRGGALPPRPLGPTPPAALSARPWLSVVPPDSEDATDKIACLTPAGVRHEILALLRGRPAPVGRMPTAVLSSLLKEAYLSRTSWWPPRNRHAFLKALFDGVKNKRTKAVPGLDDCFRPLFSSLERDPRARWAREGRPASVHWLGCVHRDMALELDSYGSGYRNCAYDLLRAVRNLSEHVQEYAAAALGGWKNVLGMGSHAGQVRYWEGVFPSLLACGVAFAKQRFGLVYELDAHIDITASASGAEDSPAPLPVLAAPVLVAASPHLAAAGPGRPLETGEDEPMSHDPAPVITTDQALEIAALIYNDETGRIAIAELGRRHAAAFRAESVSSLGDHMLELALAERRTLFSVSTARGVTTVALWQLPPSPRHPTQPPDAPFVDAVVTRTVQLELAARGRPAAPLATLAEALGARFGVRLPGKLGPSIKRCPRLLTRVGTGASAVALTAAGGTWELPWAPTPTDWAPLAAIRDSSPGIRDSSPWPSLARAPSAVAAAPTRVLLASRSAVAARPALAPEPAPADVPGMVWGNAGAANAAPRVLLVGRSAVARAAAPPWEAVTPAVPESTVVGGWGALPVLRTVPSARAVLAPAGA